MSHKYELVNPFIDGEFKRIFTGKSSLDTAHKCYSELSHYMRAPMPEFMFTMRRIKDKQLVHYMVKENSTDETTVEYSITESKIENTPEELQMFEKKLSEISTEKTGGSSKEKKKSKKDKDESSSSSSSSLSSDSERKYSNKYLYNYRPNQPILYYWYYPMIYQTRHFIVPHFKVPLTPLIQIYIPDSNIWL